MIDPYYDSGDGRVTLYCGDCLEIMPQLEAGSVDAVVTDPPYGMGQRNGGPRGKLCKAMTRVALIGNDTPFDPAPFLPAAPILCLFGANHYASRLPSKPGWLIWDKRDGLPSNVFSDAEMAWTNTLRTARIFRHQWSGMLKASENGTCRVHPTQKPIALMEWCMVQLGIPTSALVLDPFMGSGTTGVACVKTGRRFIGIEIDEGYCEIARKRIVDALSQLPLLQEAAG